MMNKKILVTMLSAFSILCSLDGLENSHTSHEGSQKYGKETLDSIQQNGSVILEGTQVLDLIQVNGSIHAERATIGTVQANGEVTLHQCVINNASFINGFLIADHTQFKKNLSVSSQKIILKACSIDSLTVRKVPGNTKTQLIDLRDGTQVTGLISVESGNGEIWVSDTKILDAQVSGAKIYKK